ncbi:MAG: membrane protein insertase YidC [Burkholderiaceae bacterium]|jgi:YidC/Oxa1 family membrane protein insertase|nr:membrane protein insertase YidC [Burkholderiaceae bacterium]
MNDIRRTILWVVFGFSMVLLWDQWQIYNGHKATFFPAPPVKAEAPAGANPVNTTGAPGVAGVPSATSTVTPQAVPGGAPSETTKSAREVIEVETDVLKLRLDSEGGSVLRAELLKHADVQQAGQPVVLLDESRERVYLAQSGLIPGAGAPALPTHKTPMTLTTQERRLADGAKELKLRFESASVNGVKLVKTYLLRRGAYDITIEHEVINQNAAAVTPQLYVQLVRDGNKPEGESAFYSTFTGPAVYTNAKKYQKVEFSDIEKNKVEMEKQSQDGYVAMVQHYFASAWWLPNNLQRDLFARKIDNNLYAVGMIAALPSLEAGKSQTLAAHLFIGPQEEHNLEALYPGLELVKDYGWLTILAKPLFWLLDQLNDQLHNWGWSIVALVFLLKIAFYWLNAQAYRSMGKMKAINPRIMEMRERLKDNPQQMQAEMMRIYREEKVNPMGGCLPIAVQIPVFIALYWVLLSTVEMRNAPWIGWVNDLAAPDPFFILPVLMTLSTMLQTWLNPTPPDPLQAKMMWIMPLAFSVMFFFFPAGLVLYWLTNNILSIAQQWMINKQLGVLK